MPESPEPMLPPSVVAISPGTLRRGSTGEVRSALELLERAVAAAFDQGVAGFMLREPFLEDGDFLRMAEALRDVVPGGSGWFCVHDRAHLVAAAGADALHLGGRSLPVDEARRVVPEGVTVGLSTHEGDVLDGALGADYAFHAPLFSPSSKRGTAPPRGLEGWAADVQGSTLPVWALGGIDGSNLSSLAGTGACGAALIGGLWGTGAEAIDGPRGPLRDLESIGERARSLVACAASIWSEERVDGD